MTIVLANAVANKLAKNEGAIFVGVFEPLAIGHEEAEGTVSVRHDVPSNAFDAKWAFGGAPEAIDAEGLLGGIEVIDAGRGSRPAMGGANNRW